MKAAVAASRSRTLRPWAFKQRVVRARKGRGSYRRDRTSLLITVTNALCGRRALPGRSSGGNARSHRLRSDRIYEGASLRREN